MKRIAITLSNELEQRLDAYRKAQSVPPSLTKVVQTALESFLEDWTRRELEKRDYEPPSRWPVAFPVDEKGSGKEDISINHDKYLAEAAKKS